MERDFIAQKTKELHIKEYLKSKLSNVGLSQIKLKRIPLGEKIIIYAARPNLIVGSRGANIRDLTYYLKKEFKLENPQIEINEIKNIFLDANVVAEKIINFLEKYGSARFKSIGHKMMENVMGAGALGVEIVLSGKIPSARAKSWRFYQGYLKKCGDVSLHVNKAIKFAALKSGIVGVKVAIMPPEIRLPDKIVVLETPTQPPAPAEKKEEAQPAKKKKGGKEKTKEPKEKKGKKTKGKGETERGEEGAKEKEAKERIKEEKATEEKEKKEEAGGEGKKEEEAVTEEKTKESRERTEQAIPEQIIIPEQTTP